MDFLIKVFTTPYCQMTMADGFVGVAVISVPLTIIYIWLSKK